MCESVFDELNAVFTYYGMDMYMIFYQIILWSFINHFIIIIF